MQIPPNLGPDYSSKFRAVFPAIARNNGAALIPFLLEGVAGRGELNQADGIHPTPEGHQIIAENVWKVVQPLLKPLVAG
jgi:acyl-CoA thioesterase-1